MITATSQTIAENQVVDNENPELSTYKEFPFSIPDGGGGTMTIHDELLNEEKPARERAMAELLLNGYTERSASFTTWRTDLRLNQTIRIKGILHKIISLSPSVDAIKGTVAVGALRYG